MSNYRRLYVPGGMFFFTVAAYGRRPILTTDAGRHFLRSAINTIRDDRPFELFATVLLPDHWHLIMQLPSGDTDYSVRMKRVKEEFTKSWLEAGLPEAKVTEAQAKKGARGIWQPRFWEHTVADEEDLERCTDYIHWNPRKHRLGSAREQNRYLGGWGRDARNEQRAPRPLHSGGSLRSTPATLIQEMPFLFWRRSLVTKVRDYPWSSFHRFVRAGDYDTDWGGEEPGRIVGDNDWGEP